MAIAIVMMSGLVGAIAAVVACVSFDFSLAQAFALYLASSTVPAVLVVGGVFLHIQTSRAMAAQDGPVETERLQR